MKNARKKIEQYIQEWRKCGYPDDIPDSIPDCLMRLQLAPSYKAIALAIMKNDVSFQSLGFAAPVSAWYSELKRIEISQRPVMQEEPEPMPVKIAIPPKEKLKRMSLVGDLAALVVSISG